MKLEIADRKMGKTHMETKQYATEKNNKEINFIFNDLIYRN